MRCETCGGYPGNEACTRCKGTGYAALHRCPNVVIGRDLGLARFFECFDLIQQGVLPVAGGWLDQTHRFAEYVKIATIARADMRKES